MAGTLQVSCPACPGAERDIEYEPRSSHEASRYLMRETRAGPPLERLVAALLGRDASAEYLVGDLREEYSDVRARWPWLVAAAWYITRAIGVVIHVRWERHRARTRSRQPFRSSSLYAGGIMSTEFRQAMRTLIRRPAFSIAIVLTVALAVAATTLVFAVVNGVLLAPLPYERPDRLVTVWEHYRVPDQEEPRNLVSPANFLRWRDELRSFDGMAAFYERGTTLLDAGEPERLGAMVASAAYFEIVGARPLVGRLYGEAEDVVDGPDVVVLAEGYWRRRFGADTSVVGRTLTIAGTPRTVLGVLPQRFDFEPTNAVGGVGTRDVWLPPRLDAEGGRFLQVMARLAPGATVEAAQQEASALAARARPRAERQFQLGSLQLSQRHAHPSRRRSLSGRTRSRGRTVRRCHQRNRREAAVARRKRNRQAHWRGLG